MSLTLSHSRRDSAGHARSGLLSLPRDLMSAAVRYWTARQVAARLGALSEHELSDIGLSRGDVAGLNPSLFGEDPTTVLARRVGRRLPPA